MVSATLVLHKGARLVEHRELPTTAPEPTRTWFPIAHRQLLDTALVTLESAGYRIARMQLALSPDDHRFFGTLDLATPLGAGIALAVGLRNSTDKTFPMGFTAGNRTFVCDNLAFRSELLVTRKHSRHGAFRFNNAIADAVKQLRSFAEVEKTRVARMQATRLAEETASHYVLRSLEEGIVSTQALPRIWKEWRQPRFEFGEPTLWRLLNAYTTVLGSRATTNPGEYAGLTIRLQGLLCPIGPFVQDTTIAAGNGHVPSA